MRTTTSTTTAAAAVVVLAFTLTACSSDSGDDGPTVSKAPASQTPTPTPSPTKQELEFKVGDTANVDTEDEKFSAAALSYRDTGIRSSIPGLLKDGHKWAIVEAKFCNISGEVTTVSPFPWTLAYPDGARYEPTHLDGGDLPSPLYPMDAKVKAGDCVRGNITFEVPKDAGRAERVLYSPDVLDEPVEWEIGKS
jgi:hypothetical protein